MTWLFSFAVFAIGGCAGEGTYRLHLVFPDQQTQDDVATVEILALEPGAQGCAELMAGEVAPEELNVTARLEVPFPPSDPSTTISVPAGDVLFFAEATLSYGGGALRGCEEAQVRADEVVEVTLVLDWACLPAFEAHRNVSLNASVTVSRTDYGTSPRMAVDGIVEDGNNWGAMGAPNWLQVDLGQEYLLTWIKVFPFTQDGSWYYYDGAWTVTYATSDAADSWLDFSMVCKQAGGGDLGGEGINIQNGDPGTTARVGSHLEYQFTFSPVRARHVRFDCLVGDRDQDSLLGEIQVFAEE